MEKQKLNEVVAAMSVEEKIKIVEEIDSEILFKELMNRDFENRKTLAGIQAALNKAKG